jgi:hypothetical protein
MANVIINDTNLTNIANAIREKNGGTTKYKPSEMANAILAIEGGGPEVDIIPTEAYVLTGDRDYYNYDGCWDWFIESVGDRIKCNNLFDGSHMFAKSKLDTIPFSLIFSNDTTSGYGNYVNNLFADANNLKTIKSISINNPENMIMMFNGCYNLREIPLSVESYKRINEGKTTYKPSNIFAYCYSLRSLPDDIAYRLYTSGATSVNILACDCIRYCSSLDEIVNIRIGILPEAGSYGNNYFGGSST